MPTVQQRDWLGYAVASFVQKLGSRYKIVGKPLEGGTAALFPIVDRNGKKWALKLGNCLDGEGNPHPHLFEVFEQEGWLLTTQPQTEAKGGLYGIDGIVKGRSGRHGKLNDSTYYIIMEWLEGDQLHKGDPLSLIEAACVMYAICAIMAYAHKLKWTHLDLKAQNIIKSKTIPIQVTVTDWTSASYGDEKPKVQIFTEGHHADDPEDWSLGAKIQQDIYALGSIMCQIILGSRSVIPAFQELAANPKLLQLPTGNDPMSKQV